MHFLVLVRVVASKQVTRGRLHFNASPSLLLGRVDHKGSKSFKKGYEPMVGSKHRVGGRGCFELPPNCRHPLIQQMFNRTRCAT